MSYKWYNQIHWYSFLSDHDNIDVFAPEVISKMRQEGGVCPGDKVTLSCSIRDSQSHAWSSNEYISDSFEQQLEFSLDDEPGTIRMSPQNPDTFAQLININTSQVDGLSQITSNLRITVLPSIKWTNHSVACTNIDIGTRSIIILQYAGEYT